MAATERDLNIIKKAEFLISNTDPTRCPEPKFPEYAFVGRSNVGKSSLINAFTNRKDLAKVSGTPGKTQTINHFLIDNNWYLVDLPGYGYAKAPKSKVLDWEKFIYDYLKTRKNLVAVFVLIDIRLEVQKNDLEFMNWLGENHIPFAMVFTKLDKLSSTQFNKHKTAYQKKMLEYWEELPPIFSTSAHHFQGLKELHQYILQNNQVYQDFLKK